MVWNSKLTRPRSQLAGKLRVLVSDCPALLIDSSSRSVSASPRLLRSVVPMEGWKSTECSDEPIADRCTRCLACSLSGTSLHGWLQMEFLPSSLTMRSRYPRRDTILRMVMTRQSVERSWHTSSWTALLTRHPKKQTKCIWVPSLLSSMQKGPHTSILVLTKENCLFTWGNLNSGRSDIFGLTLSALHRQQIKQYLPRLCSTFLNPIINKVCCRWAFTCSRPWWPQ